MLVDINLLPEKEKERSGLLYAALAVLAAALLVWLVFFALTRSAEKDTERLNTQLIKLEVTQAELAARLDRSETAQSYNVLASSVEWAESYRYETAPLLDELIAELPARGFFRSFGFSSPHQATIEVQFDDKTEAAYYLRRLLSSEHIETASIESIESEDVEEAEDADTANHLPRYVATYTVFFTDSRMTLDGTAPPVPDEEAGENTDEEDATADEQNTEEDEEPPAFDEEGSDEESN